MHRFIHFKNFADSKLNLLKPMTLLIGRNGAGKSNLIEGVELLAQLAQGRPLYEISDIGRGSGTTFQVRGGLGGCIKTNNYADSKPNHFTLEFSGAVERRGFTYRISISISTNGKAYVQEENLAWNDGTEIFEAALQQGGFLKVTFNNFARDGKERIETLSCDVSALSRYLKFAYDSKLIRALKAHLNASFVFDPSPKQMREYQNIGQTALLRDGSNLASVLYELRRGNSDQQSAFEKIIQRIKTLPEDSFQTIEFEITTLHEVALVFCHSNNMRMSAKLMSDGTLRALAILTALETVPPLSRIVIEEIDNGIHPSRVQTLVEAIWECSHRRKLNVLATTHNPATLNHLSSEQMRSVVLCYHDERTHASTLIPITDIPRSESLLERGRLGDLVTQEMLAEHLKQNFEKSRQQKTQDLLNRLTPTTKSSDV